MADALGDGDQHEEILIELIRLDFKEQLGFALVQFQQAFFRLGVLEHSLVLREFGLVFLVLRISGRRRIASLCDDTGLPGRSLRPTGLGFVGLVVGKRFETI